jgi:anti-sigma B factor antagonist
MSNDAGSATAKGGAWVRFDGRLDAVAAPDMRTALTAAVNGEGPDLTVDLSDADFIDSAALAALVSALKLSRSLGGDVRIVTPRSSTASRVFSLTQFDRVFTMLPAATGKA